MAYHKNVTDLEGTELTINPTCLILKSYFLAFKIATIRDTLIHRMQLLLHYLLQ